MYWLFAMSRISLSFRNDTGTLPISTGTPVEAPAGGLGGIEGQGPDLSAAAATLGITEQELIDALGTPPPDLGAAAATLGFMVEELQNALVGESPAGESPDEESSAPPAPGSGETNVPATEIIAATYNLVDSGQGFCYNSDGEQISCPAEGKAFYGQDAQFTSNTPSYIAPPDVDELACAPEGGPPERGGS